jgi:hypothetical protein
MECQATSFVPVTQCGPTLATDPTGSPATVTADVSCPAKQLRPQQRQDLAIQVLAGAETVSELAREHEVSRKFLYQQVDTAQQALSQAFAPPPTPSGKVLFYLPVTKEWLRQLVLCFVLICRGSTRGVVELVRDLFDYPISQGTVHNIVHSAVADARTINQQHDLSPIRNGLLDEIFQADDPVCVGVDARSTFCFLLSQQKQRDGDTWGILLLDLVKQGFAADANVADFGSGLRAGHKVALPDVPCRGDVFHVLYNIGPLVRYLENRAYEAMEVRAKLERKQATAQRRRGRKDQSLATKLSSARKAEAKVIALADEVAL